MVLQMEELLFLVELALVLEMEMVELLLVMDVVELLLVMEMVALLAEPQLPRPPPLGPPLASALCVNAFS